MHPNITKGKAKFTSHRIPVVFQLSRDYEEDFIAFAISVPQDVNMPSQGILTPLQGLYRQWQNNQSRI